ASVRFIYGTRSFVSFFFSSRRRHTRSKRDWSSDVCSSDLRGGRGDVAGPDATPASLGVQELDLRAAQHLAIHVEHDRVAGAPAARQGDHLAASQAPEGAAGAVAVRGGALPGQSLLPFGD